MDGELPPLQEKGGLVMKKFPLMWQGPEAVVARRLAECWPGLSEASRTKSAPSSPNERT